MFHSFLCTRGRWILSALSFLAVAPATLPAAPTLLYSHGDPSPAEQHNLELINRARANPPQEGVFLSELNTPRINQFYGYFSVNRAQLRSDFATYAAAPPVAFNAQLMAAARFQALDQANHNYQGHVSSDGQNIIDRVRNAGYPNPSYIAENTYAYIDSSLFAHAGFNVDWGVPSLSHRQAIMAVSQPAVAREIGISIVPVPASSTTVGPMVIVQDFALSSNNTSTPYLLGVAYQDTDNDGFYTEGEGRGGITVRPDVGDYYAVTSTSGGYAIPLLNLPAGTTSVQLIFSGGPLAQPITRTVTLNGTRNLKADLVVENTRFVSLAPETGGGTRVRWQGSVGQAYRVEYNDSLTVPWQSFPGSVTADGAGLIQYLDSAQPAPPKRAYRLVSPP